MNLQLQTSKKHQKPIPPSLVQGEGWPWGEFKPSSSRNQSTQWPKISIVTPCFKSADYLERTIRSILLQGYENLEYIVLDGGSKDETVDILQYYDDHIDYWISRPDKGQSDALNRGLDRATGDILGWLNGDDLFLPDALYAIANSYLEDPSRHLFLAKGTIVDKKFNYIHQQTYEEIGPEAFLNWRKNYIVQPGLLFSKKAWETCRPIREDLHYSMDYDLFMRMSQNFEFHLIDQEIAYSVFHEECKTVRDRAASIIETALVQVQFGGWDIARKELSQVAKEHKYLETKMQQQQQPKGEKLNVLFVITHLNVGGGQTFLVRLINSLANVVNPYLMVFWPEEINHSLVDQISKSCQNITSYELTDPQNFKSKVLELGIDVVNTHLFHADQFVASALEDVNIPMIISDHGDYKYVEEQGLVSYEEAQKILLRAGTVAVISDNNAAILQKLYGTGVKCSKIDLGVEPWIPTKNRTILRQALGISENAMVFVCVARGNEDKGWAELLTSFLTLRQKVSQECHLVLIGDGDDLKQLYESSQSNGVSTNIHFLGFQANPRSWMEMGDVTMLISYFPGESTPCALIESLSVGRPVIATDIGGIPEVVGTQDEDSAAILVPLGKNEKADIEATVQAMITYTRDQDVYHQAANNAKKRFTNKFSIDKVAMTYHSKMLSLLV